MPPEKRFEITISEKVDDTLLLGTLGSVGTSVLSEALPDGGTKITVEGATFNETLLNLRQELARRIENARLEGIIEANNESVG